MGFMDELRLGDIDLSRNLCSEGRIGDMHVENRAMYVCAIGVISSRCIICAMYPLIVHLATRAEVASADDLLFALRAKLY